jgi:hypothetical protein
MANQASAPAATTTTDKTSKKQGPKPRAFVPPIEFEGNIAKLKKLLKEHKFAEAADVFIDNGMMPEFVFRDLARYAPREIPEKLLVVQHDFVLGNLKAENVEQRGKRMSALLRAAVLLGAKSYFTEKVALHAAIKATGAKIPAIITSSAEVIESELKQHLSNEEWVSCGFAVKAENPGQLVVFHPELKQSLTIYKRVAGSQSEAEKAKEREARESKQRANQMARAALYPGKIGVGGGKKQEEGGKKGGKKK